MSRSVFWDASAFIALGNSRDALHQAAIDVSQQLAEEKAGIVTTSAILTEVANGALCKKSIQAHFTRVR